MRKFFTLITMFMLCLGMGAQTPTSLIEAYQIYALAENGQTGSSAQLFLNMKNRNSIRTWTCKLVLPEGITYQSAALTDIDARYPNGFNPEFSAVQNNDGSVTFTCEGEEGVGMVGEDGAVAVVNVNIASALEPGTYTVVVKDIHLYEPNDAEHHYTNNNNQTTFDWVIEQGATTEATITFVDVDGTVLYTITQEVGTPVTPPADPTKEGYTFIGWDSAIPETMEQDMTITAQWQLNSWPVTFLYDVDGVILKQETVNYGETITPPEEPQREGYNFDGWYPEIPETMPDSAMTFVAQWDVIYYGIEFFLDEGGDSYYIDEVAYGDAFTAPEDPTREGYTFVGWDPEIPDAMPAHDMVFIAQWEVNRHNVYYFLDVTGAIWAQFEGVAYGDEIPVPEENPTRDGYTFEGWEPASADAVPNELGTMPDFDLTFVAQWKEVETFTVTVLGEGVTVDNLNPKYGDDVTITVAPKEGYELDMLLINGNDVFHTLQWVYDEEGNIIVVIEKVTYDFTVEAVYRHVFELITLTQEWMPYSCNMSLDFANSGLEAYIVTKYYSDINYAVLERVQIVPQGTGLLLHGEVSTAEAPTYRATYLPQMPELEINLLKPVLSDRWLTPWDNDGELTNYVFDMSANGFTPLTGNGTEMFAPSAYLQLPTEDVKEGEVVRFGFLADDTEVSITGVHGSESTNAIFDLQGRRVNKAVKGIYIVNGKKIAVK